METTYVPSDACFGLSYCQAEDNLEESLRYYVLARAEGGKAFGRESLENDFQLRMLRIPQINQQLYEGMENESRQIVDAFAAGRLKKTLLSRHEFEENRESRRDLLREANP